MSARIRNYHTHTDFCDGACTAEEMILGAIAKGLSVIGFSGHVLCIWVTAVHSPGISGQCKEVGVNIARCGIDVLNVAVYICGLDFAPLYIYPSKHISVGYMRALLKELQGNPFVQQACRKKLSLSPSLSHIKIPTASFFASKINSVASELISVLMGNQTPISRHIPFILPDRNSLAKPSLSP